MRNANQLTSFYMSATFDVMRVENTFSHYIQETADSVTFTEEIINRKLHFLCRDKENIRP